MYDEDDLLPISALQHLVFCPRRCALVHLEQIWSANQYTVEGEILHERADEPGIELRDGVLTSRGVPLRSLELGLSGRCDVIEYELGQKDGATLPGRAGLWLPKPVEYKRGTPKRGIGDDVQICAQGLCLEEMMGCRVNGGAVFYASTRRRREVEFSQELREMTIQYAAELRRLLMGGSTPAAVFEKKCLSCSLIDRCLPKAAERPVGAYLKRGFSAASAEGE